MYRRWLATITKLLSSSVGVYLEACQTSKMDFSRYYLWQLTFFAWSCIITASQGKSVTKYMLMDFDCEWQGVNWIKNFMLKQKCTSWSFYCLKYGTYDHTFSYAKGLIPTSFLYPLKQQTSGFIMFPVSTEKGQWFKMR